jgi:hypothetical protein
VKFACDASESWVDAKKLEINTNLYRDCDNFQRARAQRERLDVTKGSAKAVLERHSGEEEASTERSVHQYVSTARRF